MGTVIAPPPGQCGTTAKTSERAASGPLNQGGGGHPPRTFASGLSLEKAWIPARTGREPTSQVWTCDGPNETTCRLSGAPPPGESAAVDIPRPVVYPKGNTERSPTYA